MTSRKTASDTTDTSTTAGDPPIYRLTMSRVLALALLAGAPVAWSAGAPGRMLVALALLLFGPGYLLETSLRPFRDATLCLRPALWLGLSLSAIALIYEWVTALGLSLAPLALDGLAAVCGLAVFWRLWSQDQRPKTKDQRLPISSIVSGRSFVLRASSWALGGVLALTLAIRFYQIRELALPAWVDSVHHALLIRVAAETGQAPLSLRPYLPIDQIPYHWGYHVLIAAALQLSGTTIPQAMLWSGQVLNALHVVTVASLAAYLWRRPVAGIVAGIAVGLLSIWPAYYASWGRYTQLTGLLVLPPLMIACLQLLRAPSRRLAIVLTVLLAGLSLIHALALVLALAFMAVSGAIWLLRSGGRGVRPRFAHAAASAVAALALAGPWLWTLAARSLTPSAGRSQPILGASSSYYALDEGLLWAGLNRWLIAGALLAGLWLLWRRRPFAAELLGWVAALFVLANPWLALYLLPAIGASLLAWSIPRRPLAMAGGVALLLLNPWLIKIPYIAIFTNEVVVISLFIPVAVLLGAGVGQLWAELSHDQRPLTNDEQKIPSSNHWSLVVGHWSFSGVAIGIALAALALWGGWNQRDVLNPGTIFATHADAQAIAWAAEHTPPDARFLINATPWLQTGRGADGGWWLLPLAGRWTSTPPAIYDFGPRDYVRETRANTQTVIEFQPGQERQIYDLIARERITYVYLGENAAPLTPAAFPPSAGFEKIYDRDGVSIFAVHH